MRMFHVDNSPLNYKDCKFNTCILLKLTNTSISNNLVKIVFISVVKTIPSKMFNIKMKKIKVINEIQENEINK